MHDKLILATLSAIAVLVFVTNCSPEHEDLTEADHKSLKSETESDDEALINSDNGLLMQLSMEDAENRLVKITWKNIGDTDIIVTLTRDIVIKEDALLWPCFHFKISEVPDRKPRAGLNGHMTFGDKSFELVEILKINGIPLYQNESQIERVEYVVLKPGEEIRALFSLDTLFDGIEDKDVHSVKIWFEYSCWGREQEGDMYWRGFLKSNMLELHR